MQLTYAQNSSCMLSLTSIQAQMNKVTGLNGSVVITDRQHVASSIDQPSLYCILICQ